jgi:hypothetical protein
LTSAKATRVVHAQLVTIQCRYTLRRSFRLVGERTGFYFDSDAVVRVIHSAFVFLPCRAATRLLRPAVTRPTLKP